MANEKPLAPPDDDYRTEQASPDVAPSGDPLEPEAANPATGAPVWLVVGVVLLLIFAGLLVYAVVLPALT